MSHTESSIAKQAIWFCFSSVKDMFALISNSSVTDLLYVAQDSIHVMIAYVAVLVIKVQLDQMLFLSSSASADSSPASSIFASQYKF